MRLPGYVESSRSPSRIADLQQRVLDEHAALEGLEPGEAYDAAYESGVPLVAPGADSRRYFTLLLVAASKAYTDPPEVWPFEPT